MNVGAFILTLFLANHIYGQRNNSEPIFFQVACGFAAQTSQEIRNFKKESRLQDSSKIKQKLLEGTELEQVLSAIVLKHYYANQFLNLSAIELNKLSQISSSKKKFELCFTCTFQEKGTLKELLHEKKPLPSYQIIKGFLLDKILTAANSSF